MGDERYCMIYLYTQQMFSTVSGSSRLKDKPELRASKLAALDFPHSIANSPPPRIHYQP
jgi:hypothetical protein